MQRRRERYGREAKTRVLNAILIFLMLVMMTTVGIAASESDRMPELEAGRLCTLRVMMTYTDPNMETDNIKPMSEVEVQLVNVANMEVNGGSVEYTLLENYKQSEISFAGMTVSEANEAAALLMPLVPETEVKKIKTGSDGIAEFTDLEPGMYLVYQKVGANAVYHVDEIEATLITVPIPGISSDENNWEYEISMQPKTELVGPRSNGRIRVTKQLYNTNTKLLYNPPEDTELVFYVGLFTDEACTERAAGITDQKLSFLNSNTTETVFENLKTDQTYYIAETDEKGKVVDSVRKNDAVFTAEYPKGQSVSITRRKPEGEIHFRNTTADLPEDFYYGGKLIITKKTVKNGKKYPMTQTFYAGVFSDKGYKNRMGDVVELKLNNESSVTAILDVNIGKTEDATAAYYVAETDRYGKPLKNGNELPFSFSLNKKDGKVTLTTKNQEDEVIITNEFPSVSVTPSGNANPPAGNNAPEIGNSPKTGDDTPITIYVGLLLTAVFLSGVLLLLKRKLK